MHHLGAGYLAGAIMVLATNPVWMIKTRMQLQDKTAKNGAVRPYAGLFGASLLHTFSTVVAGKASTHEALYGPAAQQLFVYPFLARPSWRVGMTGHVSA